MIVRVYDLTLLYSNKQIFCLSCLIFFPGDNNWAYLTTKALLGHTSALLHVMAFYFDKANRREGVRIRYIGREGGNTEMIQYLISLLICIKSKDLRICFNLIFHLYIYPWFLSFIIHSLNIIFRSLLFPFRFINFIELFYCPHR